VSGGTRRVFLALLVLMLRETFVTSFLLQKARRLRKQTSEPWISVLECYKAGDTAGSLFKKTIDKPFIMSTQAPMLLVPMLYVSVICGLFYLLFEAIPTVLVETHRLNAGETGCAFLALFIGCVCGCMYGCAFYILPHNTKYVRLHHATAPSWSRPRSASTPSSPRHALLRTRFVQL